MFIHVKLYLGKYDENPFLVLRKIEDQQMLLSDNIDFCAVTISLVREKYISTILCFLIRERVAGVLDQLKKRFP